MIRPLLVVLAVIGLVYLIRYIRKQPREKRPRLIVKYGLYLLAIILIGLVILGKVHWIAAGIAALLPAIQKLLFLAFRFLPFLNQWKKATAQHSSPSKEAGTKMTVEHAMDIFGFKTIESVEQITKRHKELMQKNHPDRGGSDYLAAQINQAKDILVEHIKQQ